jgi:methyl-accepting chemotaxis protein
MTPEQTQAMNQLMQLVDRLSNLTQQQAKMIEELLAQNQAMLARVEMLEALGRAKL